MAYGMRKSKLRYKQETFIATPKTKNLWIAHYKSIGKVLKVKKWKGKAGGAGWKITARRRVYS